MPAVAPGLHRVLQAAGPHAGPSGSDNAIIFPDKTIDHVTLHVTHTNLDTGFTLTETDHFTVTTATDGQNKLVGIFWHLRNADGKLVVVHAGQMVFSPTGEVLKFTPNMNPDDAAVICPALGGHPAG
jgi:molybdopterin-guanine dinucleotide biosynthesis protein A